MRCRVVVSIVLALVLLATAACSSESGTMRVEGMDSLPTADAIVEVSGSWAPAPRTAAGSTMVASAASGRLELYTAEGTRTFLPGVNLGSSEPGRFPGEVGALQRDLYRAWLEVAGCPGSRVVRVYTIHPPVFYDEFARYNRLHPDAPLYLVQGVYFADEDAFIEAGDFWDERVAEPFFEEITVALELASQGMGTFR